MRREGSAARPSGGQVEGAADATSFAHYTDEGQGLQLSPATVLTMSLIFIGVVIILHIIGKFNR